MMPNQTLAWCAIVGLGCTAMAAAADVPSGKQWVYVGTYTKNKNPGKGIYRYDFDPATGQLTAGAVAAETVNPSFLAIHPTGKFIYAVGESIRGRAAASARSASIHLAAC